MIISIYNGGSVPAIDWQFRLEEPILQEAFPANALTATLTIAAGAESSFVLPFDKVDHARLEQQIAAADALALTNFNYQRDSRLEHFATNYDKLINGSACRENDRLMRNHIKMTALGHDWPYNPRPIREFSRDEMEAAFEVSEAAACREIQGGIAFQEPQVVAISPEGEEERLDVGLERFGGYKINRTGFQPVYIEHIIVDDFGPFPTKIDAYGSSSIMEIRSTFEYEKDSVRYFSFDFSATSRCFLDFHVWLFFKSGIVECAKSGSENIRCALGSISSNSYFDDWRWRLESYGPEITWKIPDEISMTGERRQQ